MSKRINEIIEVIQEIKHDYSENHNSISISDLRVNAVQKVATKRGIAKPTVADKFRRQLMPDVNGVYEFDSLLSKWLKEGSNKDIKNILLKHSVDKTDEKLIVNFFESSAENNISSNLPRLTYEKENSTEIVIEEPKSYYEGDKLSVLITKYERDPKARQQCLEHFGIKCSICNFDFGEEYGDLASGFIHVHHIIPISEIGGNYQVNPFTDLIPVCPNCHAVIHMRRPPYSISEVKNMLKPEIL